MKQGMHRFPHSYTILRLPFAHEVGMREMRDKVEDLAGRFEPVFVKLNDLSARHHELHQGFVECCPTMPHQRMEQFASTSTPRLLVHSTKN
eukprot:4604155-Amphidinium_carterae.1